MGLLLSVASHFLRFFCHSIQQRWSFSFYCLLIPLIYISGVWTHVNAFGTIRRVRNSIDGHYSGVFIRWGSTLFFLFAFYIPVSFFILLCTPPFPFFYYFFLFNVASQIPRILCSFCHFLDTSLDTRGYSAATLSWYVYYFVWESRSAGFKWEHASLSDGIHNLASAFLHCLWRVLRYGYQCSHQNLQAEGHK